MRAIESLEERIQFAAPVAADAPPAAPIEVVGTARPDLTIHVAFTDNSTNEEAFVVEALRDGVTLRQWTLPASAPGEAGTRMFFAQEFSGITLRRTNEVSVRAVNAAGSSQPVVLSLVPVASDLGSSPVYVYPNKAFAGEPVQLEPWEPWVDKQFGTGSPDPRIPADGFSVMWEGYLRPEYAERYTFLTASSDGIALRLTDPRDGRVLIDFDNLSAVRDIPATGFQDVAGSADLEPGVRYIINVRFVEDTGWAGLRVGWSSYSTPAEPIPLNAAAPILPGGPKVKYASVTSTHFAKPYSWEPDLPLISAQVTPGPGRFEAIPWTGIDTISIAFDRSVSVDMNDLRVRGVSGDYGFTAFSRGTDHYSPNVATWTLDRPIGADRIELTLNSDRATGGVFGLDDGGQSLDGEWAPTSTKATSGDGHPGGDFRYRFDVLPGDVNGDGIVLADDFAEVKRRFFTTFRDYNPEITNRTYGYLYDINGSGDILADDYAEVKKRFFTTLPDAPAPAAAAATTAALRTSPVRRELFGAAPVL